MVETKTSCKVFDSYIQMNFIDNVLRGGLPINLATSTASSSSSPDIDPIPSIDTISLTASLPLPSVGDQNPKIFHAFSRIHGDLERDYNNFQLDPTYFSQGPGNFRDIAQNRRSDVLQVLFILFSRTPTHIFFCLLLLLVARCP